MRIRIAIALAALGLTACTTPYGPYQCRGLFPVCTGYSEIQLGPNVYRVRFEGAATADTRARVEDFTLLRAAELALESGFDHFVLLEASDSTSSQTQSSPGTYHAGTTTCSGSGKDKVCATSPGYWSGGGTYTTSQPGYAFTVQFVERPAEEEGSLAYDARAIRRDVRRKYQLPLGASRWDRDVAGGPQD